jgi:hypothetical protein
MSEFLFQREGIGEEGGGKEEEEAHSGIAHGLSSLALFNISLLRVTAYVL